MICSDHNQYVATSFWCEGVIHYMLNSYGITNTLLQVSGVKAQAAAETTKLSERLALIQQEKQQVHPTDPTLKPFSPSWVPPELPWATSAHGLRRTRARLTGPAPAGWGLGGYLDYTPYRRAHSLQPPAPLLLRSARIDRLGAVMHVPMWTGTQRDGRCWFRTEDGLFLERKQEGTTERCYK